MAALSVAACPSDAPAWFCRSNASRLVCCATASRSSPCAAPRGCGRQGSGGHAP